MTATEATAVPGPAAGPETAVQVEHLDVSYRVRGRDRLALRDVSFQIARNESYGLVGESGSGKSTVALALTRYLPRNGRVSAGSIRIAGRDPLAMNAAELRQLRARSVSMVYQEPGKALNPAIRVGPAGRRGLRGGRLRPGRRAGAVRGNASQSADLRPWPGDAAVPARVVGRHGAAGRDRDGAGVRAGAADPGRAHDRAGRHGRGRGAGPGRRAARSARHLAVVHQPQPGRHREDVRPGWRPVRGRADRGGSGQAGLRPAAAPYTMGLLRCIPRQGQRKDHGRLDAIPGFLPAPGEQLAGCIFAPRCPIAEQRCREAAPPAFDVGPWPQLPVLPARGNARPTQEHAGRRAAARPAELRHSRS